MPQHTSKKAGAYGVRGQKFHDEAVARYELTASELELLQEVCYGLDTLTALHAAVAAEGTTITGAAGSTRLHPGVAEARSTGLAVARLLAQLGLPDEAGAVMPTGLTVRSRKANATRWGTTSAERGVFRGSA
jgi:phage terminase small subunit